jgi:hypothetical protein
MRHAPPARTPHASSSVWRLAAGASLILSALLFFGASCALDAAGTQEQQCTADSQCDDANPCTADGCGASGLCEHSTLPDGLLEQQTPGDCQQGVCAAGMVQSAPDDGDRPNDANDCTRDGCDNGVPIYTNLTGTGCILDGGQGICIAGQCEPGACTAENEATVCDDGNACTEDRCTYQSGQCNWTNIADGVAPGAEQVVGDCKLIMCVSGQEQPVTDDGDLPGDGLQCTRDLCNEGYPTNPPEAISTGCDQAGGRVCDGAGTCVECNQVNDCVDLPADNECRTRTCVSNACGTDYVLVNVPLGNQNTGDCQRRECDGAGNVISVIDNNDLPNTNNPCVIDQCDNGTPTHQDRAPGFTCGTNQVCNNAGQCGCNDEIQCGSSTQCMWWTCSPQSFCVQNFELVGHVVDVQVTGDCHRVECVSNGGQANQIYDFDVPVDDGIECTAETCSNGTERHLPKLINTSCSQNGGRYCDADGTCVGCNDVDQCTGQYSCHLPGCPAQACTYDTHVGAIAAPDWQQTDNDCRVVMCDGNGNSSSVADDADLPIPDTNVCTDDQCHLGAIVRPPTAAETPCSPPTSGVCNGAVNNPACVACYDNHQCLVSPNLTCNQTTWTCQCTPTTCAALFLTCGTAPNGCSTGTLSCNNGMDGDETDVDCGGPIDHCATRCANGLHCGAHEDCLTNSYCSAGHCASKQVLGLVCSTADECQSGLCVDNRCCESSCLGTCLSCANADTGQTDGLCRPKSAVNPDPDGECASDLGGCGSDGTGCNGAPQGSACAGDCGSCYDRFFGKPGFTNVCSETAAQCVITGDTTGRTCTSICQSAGETCVGAWEDTAANNCTQTGSNLGCAQSNRPHLICYCAQSCGANPPCTALQTCNGTSCV